jgi:hypothetical protein
MLVADVEGKLRCLERELKLRRKCYPRWVASGQMTAEQAAYEEFTMAAIADDYRRLAEMREPRFEL